MYNKTSKNELEARNELMFGVKDIRSWSMMALDASEGNAMSMVRSMLSDVQEMIEMDLKEDARQALNRTKFLLSKIA